MLTTSVEQPPPVAFTFLLMRSTPSISHRAQKNLKQKMQEGTIVSFTTVRHPPEGFPSGPRVIGLIELEDGTKVTAPLIADGQLSIGMKVLPKMRLSRVNDQGLRIYDVSYQVPLQKAVKEEIPGYVLALTGPSGVGKTSISILLSTKVGKYVQRVPIVTTRQPKEGDQDEYIHVTPDEFMQLKADNKLATFTSIPSKTEKRFYGYRTEDIERIWTNGKMPVIITEMNLLQGLAAHYGRRSILSFGLMPPGKSRRQMLSSLLHRLRARGRDTEKQIEDRLKNAEADLQFFDDRKELFDHVIVNEDLDAVLTLIKGHVVELSEA